MKDIQKEITPISADDLFIVLNHPNAKFDYPVHYHSDFEINLVVNSFGERIVGDSIKEFEDLDLAMIGPNLPHAWRGQKVDGNHVITIQFSEKILDFPILNKRLFSQIKQLLIDSKKGLVFQYDTAFKMKGKLIQLTKMQGFQTVLAFFSILHELSISNRFTLTSSSYDILETMYASKSRRIAKVCNYLDENFCNPVKLNEIASLVNMSESAFCHFFKKKTNCTFVDYLANIRVSKACQLLTETSNTIAEICYSCGFNNLSNFIRTFKKKKGMTPSEYRIYIEQMLIKY